MISGSSRIKIYASSTSASSILSLDLKDSICFLNLLIKLDLATSKEILVGLSKFISFSYIYELPIAIPIEAPRPLTLVIFTSTLFKKFLFKISDYSKILLF